MTTTPAAAPAEYVERNGLGLSRTRSFQSVHRTVQIVCGSGARRPHPIGVRGCEIRAATDQSSEIELTLAGRHRCCRQGRCVSGRYAGPRRSDREEEEGAFFGVGVAGHRHHAQQCSLHRPSMSDSGVDRHRSTPGDREHLCAFQRARIRDMRVGIAHHYGWAVAVTASSSLEVVDRRRIELIEPGVPAAPFHHEGGTHHLHNSGELLDDHGLAELVAKVRRSVASMSASSLDELATSLPEPIASISVRGWPSDFPTDIATLRRPPYESRADSVMYCQVLSEVASERGWVVHTYDAKTVESDAAVILGARATDVLHGPRSTWGPPWSKDHRTALAATIVSV